MINGLGPKVMTLNPSSQRTNGLPVGIHFKNKGKEKTNEEKRKEKREKREREEIGS